MKVTNLFKKLNNRHLLSLFGNFSMAVLSFLTYSILYRNMSKTETGNWVYFQFIFLLADTFRTGFIHSALIKFNSGAGQYGKRVIGAGWSIAFIITAVFIFINLTAYLSYPYLATYFSYSDSTDEMINIIINYSSLCLLLILPLNFSSWLLQSNNRFDRILILRIINQGGFIIIIMALSFFNILNLKNLILGFMIANTITSAFCILAGWTQLYSLKFVSKESLKTFFDYGKYSTGTVVSSNLLKGSDTILIRAFLGAEALAIYNIPQKLLEVIEIPIRSFVMTAMPEMSKKIHEQKDIQAAAPIMIRYAGFLTFLLIPISIIAIVFAKLAIWMIGGQEYINTEAPNIFKIFMLLAVFFPIDRFLGITLDIINKPRLNFFKVIVMLAIQVIGGLIALYFIKSIYAIAFVSMITFAAGVLFGHISLIKYINYSLKDLWFSGKTETIKLWTAFYSNMKLK